jgi:hypothetical protein
MDKFIDFMKLLAGKAHLKQLTPNCHNIFQLVSNLIDLWLPFKNHSTLFGGQVITIALIGA